VVILLTHHIYSIRTGEWNRSYGGGEGRYQWEGGDMGKGCKRVNLVQILFKLFQEWGEGIKENDGGGEFNYHIFDLL
jgi:hypothetical protein